ncbi:NAD-dependent epimerase/dehydratase family protein [Maribacter sp. SA7]|uniref:NAD-dependent epimerase/dehydratase family protein n=1 Tax=Maribacter zhoushanensis TaxID=3030012 RepID=UPI0023EDD0C7|nr:NAD-dependent epimerase/dehydratase family protein [Maribacter zhoushanensis]MDF4202546.1 NAD-dependent epimerase/dehydratase family protein [Maribacter zhoushanensis]
MQTILGANGQIAIELAKELKKKYTSNIRLVSRNPKKVNDTDMLFSANLLDKKKTEEAVKGSDIAYLTVGLPMNTKMWVDQFPIMMRNVIDACKKHQAKLVFFDNTYMYAQNETPLTEESKFAPVGPKGKVRAEITNMLLKEMKSGQLEAVICRAPEFYGPGKTQSITNAIIFNNIKNNKKLKVFISDNTLRTLIWTPDASKAMALIGNSPDTYNQTWHLPCDDSRLTYKQFIALTSKVYGTSFQYTVVPKIAFTLGGMFKAQMKELQELLPRYKHNNIFVSTKFKNRFQDFPVTTYHEGIEQIKKE